MDKVIKQNIIPSWLYIRLPLLLFVIFYVGFSLATFKDYGSTWDESDVYFRGESLYLYFQNQLDQQDINLIEKISDDGGQMGNILYNHSYGALLHGVAVMILKNTSVQTYHLLNLLFATIIYIAAYEALLKFYKNKWLALLGPIFIFLTPRFLGDTPANPKDMPFAVVFFVGVVLIYMLSNYKNTLIKGIILGLILGIAFNFRVLGVTLVLIYALNSFYTLYINRGNQNLKAYLKDEIKTLIPLILSAYFIVTITWPYIAVSPLFHTLEVLQSSKDFAWKGSLVFNGQYLSTPELPIYYVPFLIGITTPIFILLLAISSPLIVKRILKHRLYLVMASALLLNLIMYVVLKPIVYDGLRHYLFTLPLISFIAAISLIEIIKYIKDKRIKLLLFTGITLNILLVVIQIFTLYPIHYIYYNEFVGGLKSASTRFETDYWGASFKEAINWLKTNEFKDKDRVYKVNTCANPSISIPELQPYKERKYADWVKLEDAEYFVCYTREINNFNNLNGKLIHTITKDGVNINYIYKLNR